MKPTVNMKPYFARPVRSSVSKLRSATDVKSVKEVDEPTAIYSVVFDLRDNNCVFCRLFSDF